YPRADEPLAPLAVTLMVSTYTPGVSPEVLRVQETVPLPVPFAVVSVVQLFFLAAVHEALLAPSPVRVTVALPPAAALPCCTFTYRDAGDTLIASGTGIAEISWWSIISAGGPLSRLVVLS